MQETLIDQGLNLMLYGMGTVFAFLTLLVLSTTLMSAVVRKFIKPEQAAVAPALESQPASPPVPSEIRQAIEKAIALHRGR